MKNNKKPKKQNNEGLRKDIVFSFHVQMLFSLQTTVTLLCSSFFQLYHF